MKEMFIHYIIEEGKVSENIARVRELFNSLNKRPIKGMSYSSYLMGENLFVHIARFENENAIADFSSQTEFLQFLDGLEFRLKEEPIENDIREIGFYRNIDGGG
jgi:hypothetical protein